MKHLKKFENNTQDNINKLENDIIDYEVETEDYYGDTVVSAKGKKLAAKKIVEYLTKLGINFDQYFESKKYNI